ncbi:hypothetical protein FDP41_007485 [Naegleria fowleri]|uniref:Uncharacterized protein n=1 Tax=Naegleria fowleri TaxID=5763 RepID=A0A6A5CG39_NAEFO|nr:uncharacterized protein FDP41_007485 [Naegleria fowleri]KAF0984308.1 hypothetical protein FDP41_007485 [Naegleria fowleri]CAG4715102.1 unnamed protein product [Naegleria fowleri]
MSSSSTTTTSNEVIIPEQDKVANPKSFVFFHVISCSVQVGGLLGAIYTPFHYYFKRRKDPSLSFSYFLNTRIPQYIWRGTTAGFLIGTLMYYGKARNFTQNNFDDRAFRIKHNVHCNLWQQAWLGSVVLGGVTGLVLKKPEMGIALGHAFGTVLFAGLNAAGVKPLQVRD